MYYKLRSEIKKKVCTATINEKLPMAQDLNDPKTSQYHDLILFTAVVCVVTRHARLFLLRRSVALRK